MVSIWRVLAIVALLVLIASFLGRWFAPGDSLAVFRLPIAVVTALLWLRVPLPRYLRWIGIALPIWAVAVFASAHVPGRAGQDLIVYQKNLWFGNDQVTALAKDILAADPDVITLQEVSIRNQHILDALRERYPTQAFCPFTTWSGMAVLSKLSPAGSDPICSQGRGMVALKLHGQDGPFWAVSLHLHWPWPHGQRPQFDRLLPTMAAFDAPVALGGDFNMVPWSSVMRRTARSINGQRARGIGPSLTIRHVPLLIDHVLAPGGGRVERRAQWGSDHYGLLAFVSMQSRSR